VLLVAAGAVRADPPGVVVLNERGIAHLLADQPADAVRCFEQARDALPGRRVLQRNLAAALAALAEERRRASRPLDAIDLLRRAVDLHPERLRYRVLLGRARVEGGRDVDRQLAVEDFTWVLERDPDHLDALVNLGQIRYLERELAAAEEHWRSALVLRPSDADVRARLAKARRERRVEEAYETLLSTSFRIRHAPAIPSERAAAVLRLCEEALGDLTKRFETYPGQILVTLYPPAEFRSATRMHGWVAGLSDGTIRITVAPSTTNASLRATIYHELTHHLIRCHAPRVPVWLHEGLAQIAEGKSASRALARLRRLDTPEVAELSPPSVVHLRDPRQVSRFYDLAMSFTQYLLELQGYPGFLRVFAALREGKSETEALRTVYGSPRAELFRRWRETRLRAR
jgi:tetratricopeptide (TPR) repeat protein